MTDRRAFILALGTFAAGTDAFVIAGILPDIARDLSTSIENAGLVVSVFAISYALGSPLMSALSTSWRRKSVLVVSLITFAFANILSSASPTLTVLLITRVLAALSAGLFAPAAYAVGAALGPAARRGTTLAIVVAGFSSATVVGVPIGVLIGQYIGWRGTLVFVAAITCVAATAVVKAEVPEANTDQQKIGLWQRLRPLSERNTIAVLLPFLIWSTANYALYTFVAPVFEWQLPATVISALLLMFGIGGVVGNLVGGLLYDRFGTSRPTVGCLLLLITALAAAEPARRSVILAGADALAWALCMAALYTLQQQRAIAVNPDESNLRLAVNNSAMYLGASIGSALGGVVVSKMSTGALPMASAAIASVALAALLMLPSPTGPRPLGAIIDQVMKETGAEKIDVPGSRL
jgi:MFS transporter, DHA1 family, inner membrane transport protein